MRVAFAITAIAVLVAGCPPPQQQSAPPPATPVAPEPPPDRPPADPADPKPLAADGAECLAADECQSGICEGEGCGENAGTCMSRQRACTADLRPYCGCDGETFRASSGCANRLYQHRGECKQE